MADSTKKLIMLVEDDEFIRESLTDILEVEGYRVICAANGEEGVNLLRNHEELPGLVLLDLMMPVKDGFYFREVQKSDPRISAIPVVIMSADGNVEEKQGRAKAQGYLKKPVEMDEVIFTVKNYAS